MKLKGPVSTQTCCTVSQQVPESVWNLQHRVLNSKGVDSAVAAFCIASWLIATD